MYGGNYSGGYPPPGQGYPPQGYPPPGQPYPPQGYPPPGQPYPAQYPPPGYAPAPGVYAAPPPQQAQAYYASQGRQLFVQATLAPGGYVAPQPQYVAYPGVAYGGGYYNKKAGEVGMHAQKFPLGQQQFPIIIRGTRLQIVGAFVLFTLLAAPVAWHLTQVERVDLPVDRIQQLSWAASRFSGPEKFQVDIYSLSSVSSSAPPSSASNVAYLMHNLQLNAGQKSSLQTAMRTGLQATDEALKTLKADHMRFSVFLLCDKNAAVSTPALTVGKYRHAWSSQCQVNKGDAVHFAIERLVQRHVYPQKSIMQNTGTKPARKALRYRLQFSLLKENPTTPWNEDLRTLVDQYLSRFVHKVGALANFTIETQMVQYARLAREVTSSADGKEFYINADDLKHFKSANDFLDASVLDDGEQVLHFMAALPDIKHAPLYIRAAENDASLATSFELPGWGIAAILNPFVFNGKPSADVSAEETATTKTRELQRVMGLFVTEFRALLGVPSFTKRQREEDRTSHGTAEQRLLFLPSPVDGIADWELDVIARDRFSKLMQTAIETLQSTVELVEALPELSVLERVQTRVESAVTRLEAILCGSAREQECVEVSDLRSLLAMARQASELTDAAYYDHTMIRQLYFPQEQMLGVYAPLLAPLILPFVLGLVRELKRFKVKRAATGKV